jgi:hypothetical protein
MADIPNRRANSARLTYSMFDFLSATSYPQVINKLSTLSKSDGIFFTGRVWHYP